MFSADVAPGAERGHRLPLPIGELGGYLIPPPLTPLGGHMPLTVDGPLYGGLLLATLLRRGTPPCRRLGRPRHSARASVSRVSEWKRVVTANQQRVIASHLFSGKLAPARA